MTEMYFIEEQMRQMLEAQIKDAGSVRPWARKNRVNVSSVGDAIYKNENFPPVVAKAMGFVKVKEPRRWVKKQPTK